MICCSYVSSFKATDITQQKKSYRVLEQICSADSDHCQRFVVSNLNELQDILVKALAASNSASKTVSNVILMRFVNITIDKMFLHLVLFFII